MVSSSTGKRKIEISFDIHGNPVGTNKAKLRTCTLALLKSTMGLQYEDWRVVSSDLKNELWNSLLDDFDLKSVNKDNIMSQAAEQWRTWKKNVRNRTFGDGATSTEILRFKDNPPEEEGIRLAEWNVFVEREADPKKLQQKAQNKANRAKKTDVHLLGAKSYAQVSTEWMERTKGTGDEGLAPSRTNLYVHARKKKSGEYHPSFAETAVKISQIQETQGRESSSTDVDTDPLTQVFGKDKSGRTRGVGSKVSKTKYKATQPIMCEIDQMKREMKDHDSKIDTILSILQDRPTEDPDLSSSGTSQSIAQKASTIGEGSSAQPMSVDNSPMKAHKGYYHLRDLKNEKNIAMVTIDTVEPGTVVNSRPLKCPEAKLTILSIYPNMGNEPVYLGKQGGATCLEDCSEGLFIAWPLYLLKEML